MAFRAPRDTSYLKPRGQKENTLTLSEMARFVGCDPSWLRTLEAQNRIPKAARVKRGQLNVRIWTIEQGEEIKRILATHRPGRPSNSA